MLSEFSENSNFAFSSLSQGPLTRLGWLKSSPSLVGGEKKVKGDGDPAPLGWLGTRPGSSSMTESGNPFLVAAGRRLHAVARSGSRPVVDHMFHS